MNLDPAGQPASGAARQRGHRAELAARLLADAPRAAHALDWAALDAAPPWLGLGPAARALFARRVGAVLAAPALRLWIAAPRIGAVQAAVGVDWWQALVGRTDWPALPPALPAWPDDGPSGAAGIAASLQAAGAAVLLATLPHGALRHVASELLAPAAAFLVPPPAARALLETALALQCARAGAPQVGTGA